MTTTTTAPAPYPNTDLDTPSTTEQDTATGEDLAAAVDALIGGGLLDSGILGGGLSGLFGCMEWAEEEIAKARARHPRHADRIYHSFLLLTPTHQLMRAEFVYRAHCRELLDRVAAGEDTRPGTAAEVCCAISAVSLASPLRSAAAGLYMRMWQAAGFPDFPEFAEAGYHHEALEQSVIDDHEQVTRRRLATQRPPRTTNTVAKVTPCQKYLGDHSSGMGRSGLRSFCCRAQPRIFSTFGSGSSFSSGIASSSYYPAAFTADSPSRGATIASVPGPVIIPTWSPSCHPARLRRDRRAVRLIPCPRHLLPDLECPVVQHRQAQFVVDTVGDGQGQRRCSVERCLRPVLGDTERSSVGGIDEEKPLHSDLSARRW